MEGNMYHEKYVNKWTMTEVPAKERTMGQLKAGRRLRKSDFADLDKLRQADLSDQDVRLARRIWNDHVEPCKEEFITVVFNEIFTRHPEITDVFMRLDALRLPRISIAEKMSFKNYYMARIMMMLREMLDSMDRPRKLTKLMTKMGLLYSKTILNKDPGSRMLAEFQKTMIDTIRLAMSDRMSPAEEAAFSKCFELAFSIMVEASRTFNELFIEALVPHKRSSRQKHHSPRSSGH